MSTMGIPIPQHAFILPIAGDGLHTASCSCGARASVVDNEAGEVWYVLHARWPEKTAAELATMAARVNRHPDRDEDGRLRVSTPTCTWCQSPIRQIRDEDGLDPADDFSWVHEGGNPYCDLHPTAAPAADPTTDLADLRVLLTRWGVPHETGEREPPEETGHYVLVTAEHREEGKAVGYYGFYTYFEFDTEGRFLRMGAWE